MHRRFARRVVAGIVALAACLPASLVGAQEANARAQVERRLGSVQTLIEGSSGAKQIETAGNPGAAQKRADAKALHEQASRAFAAGDYPATSKYLDDAARTMFEAVRLASPETVKASKDRQDFDARLASTKALLDAQRRISQEKGAGPANADVVRKVESLVARAETLAGADKLTEARGVLDQAYLASKAAVERLRSGDTLVRSLNFASKEEEYHYELDRNDTHLMLVKLLLDERRGNASVDALVQKHVDAAQGKRQIALGQAAQRQFEAAIASLEESTRELVRAIRGAGVYIPG